MELLTRKQAMEYLRIGSTKLWELTKENKIEVYQAVAGGKMLFDRQDLDRYIRSQIVKPASLPGGMTLRKRRM